MLKQQVPVRTFADWADQPSGFCEADFVAHNGGISSGACIHSLVITDVASGWTESLPLVSRQQDLVVEALDVLQVQMPMKLLGLDTDNDGAFMNETVFNYCRKHDIALTRSQKKACKKAALEGLLVHDLRRSGISLMRQNGIPENVAMQITGHKTRSTFDRYSIIVSKDLEDAAQRMSEKKVKTN